MVAAIALFLLRAQTPKITLDVPATTADKAVAKLAEAAGAKLLCATSLAGEVVVLRVHETPLAEVKKRLARVLDAVWTKRAKDEVLERTRDYARRADREQLQARAARFASAARARSQVKSWNNADLNVLMTRLAEETNGYSLASWDKAPDFLSRLNSLNADVPMGRALSKLLGVMDWTEPASLANGESLALSSSPTRAQKSLPAEASGVLAAFNTEQRAFASDVERLRQPTLANPVDPRFGVTSQQPDASRFVLTVRRWVHGDALSLVLYAVTPEGWIIGRAATVLAPNDAARNQDVDDVSYNVPQALAETADLIKVVGYPNAQPRGSRTRARLLAAWSEQLTHPETFDPLRFVASPALELAAKALNRNLIACIPDQALMWRPDWAPGAKVSVRQLFKEVESVWTGKITIDSDYLEVSPLTPVMARRERLQRAPLGALLRTITREGNLGLDALADYANAQGGALCLYSLDADFLGMAGGRPGAFSAIERGSSELRPALRLWGALSKEERRLLRQDGSVRIFGDTQQKRRASEMLYAAYALSQSRLRNGQPAPRSDYPLGHISSEPTECCPDGLPADSTLLCGPLSEVLLTPDGDSDAETTNAFTPESLIALLGRWGDGPPSGSYRIGKADIFNLTLKVGPSATIQAKLGQQGPEWSSPVPYGDLPQQVRTRIEAALRSAAERRKIDVLPPPPR